MKKRLLTVCMIVCMMISMVPLCGVYAFSDVTEETQYSAAISQLKEWGKIEGYGDGTYRPTEKITRAEFVKMLMSLQTNSALEYIQEDAKTGFDDVDNSEEPHWAARYISYAVSKNVINGYGDGTFRPDNHVTYQEAMKMVVCLLGYGRRASVKAEEIGLPLWPDGYMSVAADLSLTKSISVDSFAEQATRGAVAQIIYNATSVQEVDPDTLQPLYVTQSSTGSGSSGGGGGGGGRPSGGSGGGGGGNSISVNNLTAYGVIVATDDIFIDDEIYRKNNGASLSTGLMVFKEDKTDKYITLYTGKDSNSVGYTDMIGYRVKLTYQEIDDRLVQYQVVGITVKDTETTPKVSAEDIADAKDGIFWYFDSDNKKQKYRYDIANMQFMYNGEIVRNEDGTTTGMEKLITDEDLMPEVGSVRLIDTDGDGTADYGIIESYTTVVVGKCSTETVQPDPNNADSKYKRYTVTDKYVTEGEGEEATAKTYTFDTRNLENEKGDEVSSLSLSAWDVVYLAQTKDLSKTIIRVVSKSNAKEITVSEMDTDGSYITDSTSSKKKYEASKYFLNNVWNGIKDDLESGVKLTLYLNPDGKIAAAQIGEPSYTVGYLVNAAMNSTTHELELRIVTSGNKTKNDAQNYAITSTAKLDGLAVDKEDILEKLEANAALIADGKSPDIMQNAALAQPIRFETYGTSKTSSLPLVKNLDIVKPESDYLYKTSEDATEKNAAKQYITSSSGKGFGGTIYGMTLQIPSSASSKPTTVILLPNDRTETQYYQIGSVSSLESNGYLKAFTYYNVEPYVVEYNDGTQRDDIFVIYYEDTYAAASVNSPVAIVKSFKDATDDAGRQVQKIETISASASSGTSTQTYVATNSEIKNAIYYGEKNGEKHEVEVGDVITFGKTMDNAQICNIQILFDANAGDKNRQQHLLLDEGGDVHTNSKVEAYYRIALGVVSSVPDGSTSETQASATVNNESVTEQFKTFTVNNATTKTIYGYDPSDSSSDNKPSTVDEENKTLKFSEYAQVGDFVFVFQTGENERFVYVVKNQTIVTDGGEDNRENGNESEGNATEGNETVTEPSQNVTNSENNAGENKEENTEENKEDTEESETEEV